MKPTYTVIVYFSDKESLEINNVSEINGDCNSIVLKSKTLFSTTTVILLKNVLRYEIIESI